MGFFGSLFSFLRRKSNPTRIEDQLEERRLRPRVNPKENTRVLVIDDSPTILTAMKRFVESAHCVFLGALDAKMGMEVALTQKPDLIFLDIVMPGINGFAALRALRKNSRTRDIPIIMMSGNEQAKAQFFGAHIGADDFMKKPFSRFEVFARIARLLDDSCVPRRAPISASPQQDTAAEPASPSPAAGQIHKTAHLELEPEVAAEIEAKAQVSARPPAAAPEASDGRPQPEPVLTSVQDDETPPEEPPHLHVVHVAEEPPAPPEHPAPAQPVSAQVVPIAPLPAAAPGISPELLSRIARLAQLAQSDHEALKALVVLSAQLAAQYTASVKAGYPQGEAIRAAAP